MEIKVMTFNIHHGKGIDKEVNLGRTASVIEKSGADIIGLNEVDKHFSKRSDYKDQVAELAKYLSFDYAFSPALTLKSNPFAEDRQYGNALLSRYPIEKSKSHLFPVTGYHAENRSLLEATVLLNKQRLNMYVTHLSLNPFLHQKQTAFILDRTEREDHPTVLLGDFNMRPGTNRWKKFNQRFVDAWRKAGVGNGYTYPSTRPRLRLDYIFVTSPIQIIDMNVFTSLPECSDHLPILATLLFNAHSSQ
ncbi:endonuclease/exonuclease/phosphatase family protein [Shouchella tritolerans]|uniref:endonuclease/exonuclease/phosphatase family protein n=1 Tax=Shouchella tritolerans TaxID=2979466 RepID=UPI0021E8C9AB|nr:endonuclease/exonuclease/phosphatase family protein [Shouchella tritolerans]